MSKLYNTQKEITTNFRKFFSKHIPNIRKTQLKILPEILFGIIKSESVSSFDIAKTLKDEFCFVQFDKDYSYRFRGIETVFKNQKTNGFNLEKICNANITAFTTMYTLLCICVTYLTLLGTDYSKNSRCYKNEKIETHKTYMINGKRIKKRIMSLFNTGLTLFNRAFCSCKYIRLPFTFILYNI